MIGNTSSSFLTRMRRKFFNWRLNREIFHNIFPHVTRESNEGYSFSSYADMHTQTEALDLQELLADVECQIAKLPTAYSLCFRYAMHRDIYERLRLYAEVAKRRTKPELNNPTFVAKHA
jgi:hypothetical protein